MCKPMPASHALVEPWFQALLKLQANCRTLRTLAAPVRDYPQAVMEVYHARQAAALRAEYQHKRPEYPA